MLALKDDIEGGASPVMSRVYLHAGNNKPQLSQQNRTLCAIG
jgi:hypothetical protein